MKKYILILSILFLFVVSAQAQLWTEEPVYPDYGNDTGNSPSSPISYAVGGGSGGQDDFTGENDETEENETGYNDPSSPIGSGQAVLFLLAFAYIITLGIRMRKTVGAEHFPPANDDTNNTKQ